MQDVVFLRRITFKSPSWGRGVCQKIITLLFLFQAQSLVIVCKFDTITLTGVY